MEKTYSKYARILDEISPNWTGNQERDLMFLKLMQNYANELLKIKKTVFLNEVYEMLGLPRTQEGQVVGWHYDIKNPIGDNYIDFGLGDVTISELQSNCIVLDFNVDGRVDQYL